MHELLVFLFFSLQHKIVENHPTSEGNSKEIKITYIASQKAGDSPDRRGGNDKAANLITNRAVMRKIMISNFLNYMRHTIHGQVRSVIDEMLCRFRCKRKHQRDRQVERNMRKNFKSARFQRFYREGGALFFGLEKCRAQFGRER